MLIVLLYYFDTCAKIIQHLQGWARRKRTIFLSLKIFIFYKSLYFNDLKIFKKIFRVLALVLHLLKGRNYHILPSVDSFYFHGSKRIKKERFQERTLFQTVFALRSDSTPQ